MRKIKTAFALIAAWLSICITMVSMAAGNTETEILSLHRQNPEENVQFQEENLFPGDSVTRYYRVKVSYTGTVSVFFQVQPEVGDEKLAEVLKLKVRLINTNQLLYEGSIAEMHVQEQILTTNLREKTDELQYEITVSLGTEAGNEYQDKQLIADFVWWAEGSEASTEASTEESTEGSTEDTTEDSTEGSTEDNGGSGGELVDPPYTGDNNRILVWLLCGSVALAVFFAALMRNRTDGKRKKRRWTGIFYIFLLVAAFGITSFALMYQKVMVEENLFATGRVDICLNNDQPVFDEEILFEPGMRVAKEFTLCNDSTCEVYFRLWFSEIEGAFAEELEDCVTDCGSILFEGKFSEMSGIKSEGADGTLAVGEQRVLVITFHVTEDCENSMQGQTLLFDLNAEAVQAVNNPDGVFE